MSTNTLSTQESLFATALYDFMKTHYPEMLSTFGIWRIHEHFEIASDEVLHETSDASCRESTLRVIKKSELPSEAFASSWKLSANGPLVTTWCCDGPTRPIN